MKSFKHILRRSFITGLVALIPLFLTIYIAIKVVEIIESAADIFLGPLAAIPGLGFILFILIVLFVGFITQYYLGRQAFEFLENVFTRIPFVKNIYSSIKQVSQSVYNRDKFLIKKTVLLEYPKKDSFAMGFITSELTHPENFGLDKDARYYSVFVPTTPNPTSGFNLILKESQIIPLDMSTEEGMKFIISLGSVYKGSKSSPVDTFPPSTS